MSISSVLFNYGYYYKHRQIMNYYCYLCSCNNFLCKSFLRPDRGVIKMKYLNNNNNIIRSNFFCPSHLKEVEESDQRCFAEIFLSFAKEEESRDPGVQQLGIFLGHGDKV